MIERFLETNSEVYAVLCEHSNETVSKKAYKSENTSVLCQCFIKLFAQVDGWLHRGAGCMSVYAVQRVHTPQAIQGRH